MKRFLICGSGQHGSKWIAVLLSTLEIPCTHERFSLAQNPQEWMQSLRTWKFLGESSWLASLIMRQVPRDVIVFYQYKNRDYVIRKLKEDEFLSDTTDEKINRINSLFLYLYPELKKIRRQSKRIARVYDLFMKFAKQRADMIYSIDEFDVSTLQQMLTLIKAPKEYLNPELLQATLDLIPIDADIAFTQRSTHRFTETMKHYSELKY